MFIDPSMRALEKGLNGASVRHQILSNNVANVNTPGYKRTDIAFDRLLQRAMDAPISLKATNEAHIQPPGFSPEKQHEVYRDPTSLREDGNNVDIDREMVFVAENSLYYAALSRQISDKFSRLKTAINEGRR